MSRDQARWMLLCALLTLAGNAAARDLTVKAIGPDGAPLQYAAVQIDWPGGPSPRVPAKPLEMTQRNLRFSPHMMIVPRGASVTFPNYDQTRHHVYSFSKARQFDIELYLGLPDQPVQFDDTGVVTLGCNIHDQMQAFLIVSDAARAGVTDADGRVHFTGLPARPVQVSVWHPWMLTESERVEREAAPPTTTVDIRLDNVSPPPPSTRDNSLQERFDAIAK